MSVRIRLTRAGRKKQPYYRIVVIDSRKRRDGAYIEQIGLYHPTFQPARIEIQEDRALKWLKDGAKPSDTVHNLLSKNGTLLKFDLLKRGSTPEQIEAALAKWREITENRRPKDKGQRKAAKQPEPEKEEKTVEPDATPSE